VKNGKFPLHFSTPVKIICDFAELFEGGFVVFDDFLGEYVGIGQLSDSSRLSSLS
jgi:hypothetical protein